jgi:hypothetical protein
MRLRKPYGAILKARVCFVDGKNLFRVHDAAMSGIVTFLRQGAGKIPLTIQSGRAFW